MPSDTTIKFYLRHRTALWIGAWIEAATFYLFLACYGSTFFRGALGLVIFMAIATPVAVGVLLTVPTITRKPPEAASEEAVSRVKSELTGFKQRQEPNSAVIGLSSMFPLAILFAHLLAGAVGLVINTDLLAVPLMVAMLLALAVAYLATGIAIEFGHHFLHIQPTPFALASRRRKMDTSEPVKADGSLSDRDRRLLAELEEQFKS